MATRKIGPRPATFQDLILAGIRRIDAAGAIQSRYPESSTVLETGSSQAPSSLESYEKHILGLVDGERSVLEICQESEIGDNETSKVLYALLSTGILKVKGKKVRTLDQDFVPEDTLYSVLTSFNQMYSYIFRYMVREVGPIAENVLEKYLGTLREARKNVFLGVKLQKDGSLDPSTVERNLNKAPEDARRPLLVDSLNELLYAELLAVKRTLGAEHESAIIKAFRER